MATTIHLGDCLSGCEVCTANYHEGRNICDTCMKYVGKGRM